MILIIRRMPPATNCDVLHLYSISNMIQISLARILYIFDPSDLSLPSAQEKIISAQSHVGMEEGISVILVT